ncbi:MAG: hypothetical protein O9333_17915 [Beijerinckiaceae bacterium]|jgi:hypothetical protein|nr:hypothetical protein [Beijerinckiaceae bacterium]
MPPGFAQALIVAIIAGFGTALLSGFLTPGTMQAALLSLIAPTPLLIVGFGWHPYAGALAGLSAALIVQSVAGTPPAMAIAALFSLPVFGLTWLAEARFAPLSGRPERDGIETGRLILILISYIAVAFVVAGLILEPDFAALQQRIRRSVEAVFGMIGLPRGGRALPPGDMTRIFDLMVSIIMPVSALITLVTLMASAAIGLFVADRSRRLVFIKPDLRRFRLPGGTLILLGLALLASMRDGYIGLFGSIMALGLLFALILQGLAVVHVRTIGMESRGFLLTAIWAALIVFGLPALIFLVIGMIDHITDFRRGRL